jgi:hypothetical protein
MALNTFNLTRPKYRIPLSAAVGGGFKPGVGLIMDDPLYPTRAPVVAFESLDKAATIQDKSLPHDDIISASVSYRSAASAYDEARMLSLYFRLGFPFGGFQAAYSHAQNVFAASQTTYALINWSGQTEQLAESSRTWGDEDMTAELISNPEERLRQFIYTFGSHYISSLVYGYRVAVRAQVNTKDTATFTAVKANFNAAIGLWSAGAAIDVTHKKKLKDSAIEITAEVTAGVIQPPTAFVLTGVDQVVDFLLKLRGGDITIKPAPTDAIVFSYWATLPPDKFPNCREILAEKQFAPPEALFGVPRGAIVAWSPPPEHIIQPDDPGAKPQIVPPPEWAICDGSNGTPNLTRRFVMGAGAEGDLGEEGGQEKHSHATLVAGATMDHQPAEPSFNVGYYRPSAFLHGGQDGQYRNHAHKVEVKAESTLPPYRALVYIMKL